MCELSSAPSRLNAILRLHLGWLVARKTHAVIYICRDQEGCRRIEIRVTDEATRFLDALDHPERFESGLAWLSDRPSVLPS